MKHQHGRISWAARYDALIWLVTLGRERRFREKLIRPARLRPGERVLDVGCGTGAVAMAAKRIVGKEGVVFGIDPSHEMLQRGRRKVAKARLDIALQPGSAESIPFADGSFDVVLSTVMLHHVPRSARPVVFTEMRRVLKPGGRLYIVDFGRTDHPRSIVGKMHRHALHQADDLAELASGAGLRVVESKPSDMWDLQYVLATA